MWKYKRSSLSSFAVVLALCCITLCIIGVKSTGGQLDKGARDKSPLKPVSATYTPTSAGGTFSLFSQTPVIHVSPVSTNTKTHVKLKHNDGHLGTTSTHSLFPSSRMAIRKTTFHIPENHPTTQLLDTSNLYRGTFTLEPTKTQQGKKMSLKVKPRNSVRPTTSHLLQPTASRRAVVLVSVSNISPSAKVVGFETKLHGTVQSAVSQERQRSILYSTRSTGLPQVSSKSNAAMLSSEYISTAVIDSLGIHTRHIKTKISETKKTYLSSSSAVPKVISSVQGHTFVGAISLAARTSTLSTIGEPFSTSVGQTEAGTKYMVSLSKFPGGMSQHPDTSKDISGVSSKHSDVFPTSLQTTGSPADIQVPNTMQLPLKSSSGYATPLISGLSVTTLQHGILSVVASAHGTESPVGRASEGSLTPVCASACLQTTSEETLVNTEMDSLQLWTRKLHEPALSSIGTGSEMKTDPLYSLSHSKNVLDSEVTPVVPFDATISLTNSDTEEIAMHPQTYKDFSVIHESMLQSSFPGVQHANVHVSSTSNLFTSLHSVSDETTFDQTLSVETVAQNSEFVPIISSEVTPTDLLPSTFEAELSSHYSEPNTLQISSPPVEIINTPTSIVDNVGSGEYLNLDASQAPFTAGSFVTPSHSPILYLPPSIQPSPTSEINYSSPSKNISGIHMPAIVTRPPRKLKKTTTMLTTRIVFGKTTSTTPKNIQPPKPKPSTKPTAAKKPHTPSTSTTKKPIVTKYPTTAAIPLGKTTKPTTLKPTLKRPSWTPSLYITVLLKISWLQFCKDFDKFRNVVVKVLNQHSEEQVFPQQVKLTDKMKCKPKKDKTWGARRTKRSPGISVDFFITSEKGIYSYKLTERLATVLEGGYSTALNEVFKDKLVAFKIHGKKQYPGTAGGPGVEGLEIGIVVAIVIASVAGVAFLILIILQLVLLHKRRSLKKMRYVYNNGHSPGDGQSISSIQLTSLNSGGAGFAYDNPALDDETAMVKNLTSRSVHYAAISRACENVTALEDEFLMIPNYMPRLSEVPVGAEDKNRYANVIPVTETRVRLISLYGEEHSDYINANYVRGYYNEPRRYIATQAPLEDTREDFWRMVWEQQSQVIIMLTKLDENGLSKCPEYWPNTDTGDTIRMYGDYEVLLNDRDVKDDWVVSSLSLKHMERNLCREVHHFWYTSWPDHGVPGNPETLVKFLLEARPFMDESHGPTVVHCSPGTGRTGTVIATDICLRSFDDTSTVDVLYTVLSIRQDRAGAVQTKEQYVFIYKTVRDYVRMQSKSNVSGSSSVSSSTTSLGNGTGC